MTESAKSLDVRKKRKKKIVKLYRGFAIFIKFENSSKPLRYITQVYPYNWRDSFNLLCED